MFQSSIRTVTQGNWCIAFRFRGSDPRPELSVHIPSGKPMFINGVMQPDDNIYGEGHKQQFESADAATEFCLKQGYLQPWPIVG